MSAALTTATAAFTARLESLIEERLTDAAGDLRAFGGELAASGAQLAIADLTAEERREGARELLAQLRALAEAHRIEAERAAWVAFEDGVRQALELGVEVAIAVVLKQGVSL
jgi:hypothetical protein